jgi:hypothetical protein
MALVRVTAESTGNDEYDIRVGVNWTGNAPLTILMMTNGGLVSDHLSIPLHAYTPVETTVNAAGPALDYHRDVHDLALDCVNQGGIPGLAHDPACTGPASVDDDAARSHSANGL